MKKRGYTLRERALQQDKTRKRIVEATAALHAEIGPAATTVSAIAERAGVQRLTVYRHFPDDAVLFQACGALFDERVPAPDPALWNRVEDPAERVRTALTALYRYYEAGAPMMAHVLRDAERVPVLQDVLESTARYMTTMAADLAAGWHVGPESRMLFDAALTLSLDFWSWRSLADSGVASADAASLMTRVLEAAAAG
ncbi:hypothetical protein BH23GEM8_BH23GEM8_10770 [soil metagenome]